MQTIPGDRLPVRRVWRNTERTSSTLLTAPLSASDHAETLQSELNNVKLEFLEFQSHTRHHTAELEQQIDALARELAQVSAERDHAIATITKHTSPAQQSRAETQAMIPSTSPAHEVACQTPPEWIACQPHTLAAAQGSPVAHNAQSHILQSLSLSQQTYLRKVLHELSDTQMNHSVAQATIQGQIATNQALSTELAALRDELLQAHMQHDTAREDIARLHARESELAAAAASAQSELQSQRADIAEVHALVCDGICTGILVWPWRGSTHTHTHVPGACSAIYRETSCLQRTQSMPASNKHSLTCSRSVIETVPQRLHWLARCRLGWIRLSVRWQAWPVG